MTNPTEQREAVAVEEAVRAVLKKWKAAASGQGWPAIEWAELAVRALLSAPQDRGVGAWQPIETAPVCQRVLVIFKVGNTRAEQVVAEKIPAHANSWMCEGYRMTVKPTHWMPLPAAPGSASPSPSPVVDAPIATGERLEAEEKEMFRLADRLGYVCTPEQQHPDSPHVQEQEETHIAIKDEAREEVALWHDSEALRCEKEAQFASNRGSRGDAAYLNDNATRHRNYAARARSVKGQS